MLFKELNIPGVFVIEPNCATDERGMFMRTFCRREFEEMGLKTTYAQCNLVVNPLAGTLRGMHFQVAPHQEAKLVRCFRGAVFDVVVDLRRNSPTFGEWAAVELLAWDRHAIYIPEGLAHGMITLSDDTELFYQMSDFYEPSASRGIRWDDPDLSIKWPRTPTRISHRDRNLPSLRELLDESDEWCIAAADAPKG